MEIAKPITESMAWFTPKTAEQLEMETEARNRLDAFDNAMENGTIEECLAYTRHLIEQMRRQREALEREI